AKEVDFTARNFATIAPAAQGPPGRTGPKAELSPDLGTETLRAREACSYATASHSFFDSWDSHAQKLEVAARCPRSLAGSRACACRGADQELPRLRARAHGRRGAGRE